MKALALDLGKFNTMCCFFDTKTHKAEFLAEATVKHYLSTIFKKRKFDLVGDHPIVASDFATCRQRTTATRRASHC